VRADTAGIQIVPIGGPDATTDARIQLPAAGQPLFVRIYALDADAVNVVALGNTLVLTPD
jgi:hypothetical protein